MTDKWRFPTARAYFSTEAPAVDQISINRLPFQRQIEIHWPGNDGGRKKEVSLWQGAFSEALGSECKEWCRFLHFCPCCTLVGAVLRKPEWQSRLSAPHLWSQSKGCIVSGEWGYNFRMQIAPTSIPGSLRVLRIVVRSSSHPAWWTCELKGLNLPFTSAVTCQK